MVKLEEAVIARLEHSGEKFEILVDPELAMDLKKGKNVNFNELLASDLVFKDQRLGEIAKEELVKKVFGTTSIEEIAKRIILHGRVQLTTDQRRKMLEQRRKEVISMIARNAVNPQTNAPHPEKRIEIALQEAKIQIDPSSTAAEQMNGIIKELKKLIPISLEKLEIAVKIRAIHAGRASAVLHKFEIKKEEWQRDGSIIVVLELTPGSKMDLFNELNHVTHGEFDSKILEKK